MVNDLSSEQRNWRIRIFAITWLAYAGFYLCRKNISIVMIELEKIGFDKGYLATIITLYSLFYALGQFSSGVLSDRFGPRRIVGAGLLVSAAANILMGFWANMLIVLMILACVNGMAQSTGWSGLVKNMANWFRPKERGIVMAWWGTNYVLGGLIATSFTTYCVYDLPFFTELGWQRGFWIPSILLSIVGVSFILITRNKPTEAGIPEIVVEEKISDSARLADSKLSESAKSIKIYKEVLANPSVWLIAMMYFFLKLTRYSFLFWLPFYMTEHLGYTGSEAGYTSVVFELVGFMGAIFAGYASDKLFQSRRMPVGAIMLWMLALVFLVHPTLAGWSHFGNAIGIGLIGFFTFGPDTLMTGAGAQDAGSKHMAATAAGFINGVGSFGQMCSAYVVWWVTETYGWNSLFYLFVVFAFIGGCILSLRWNHKAATPENE